MIIGLYMVVPLMKKIAESKFLIKYFFLLSLIFVFIIPSIIYSIRIFAPNHGNFIKNFINRFSPQLVLGYSGYFLLGYYLNKINISQKLTRCIYILGIIGFIGAMFMSISISLMTNKPNQFFNMPLSITALLESTAIFVFCKKNLTSRCKFPDFYQNILSELISYTLL